jgi:hypothetical protein
MKIFKNPNRFEQKSPLAKAFPKLSKVIQAEEAMCERIEDILTDTVKKGCAAKANNLQTGNCSNNSSGRATKIDIVLLIDTSGSMSDEATELSQVAQAAINNASHNCPSDLRVSYFGIEGVWNNTLFIQSYRTYLNNLGVLNTDIVGTPNDREDGAAAIIDICNHFDWRPNSQKIIFYLGDEALEGGDPQDADDVAAANSAVAVANNLGATVFMYLGTGTNIVDTKTEYQKVATQTGGQFLQAPSTSFGGFQTVLEKMICSGASSGCKVAEKPKIVPCIQVRWGDSPNDQIETDDCEVLCITVSNPYSNIVLKDFTLNVFLLDSSMQEVPLLPDGTPSLFIKPSYLIKYGNIGACGDKTNPSSVTKENVLVTRGAKEGKYNIVMVYCFQACFNYVASTSPITFQLVTS